MAIDIRRKTSTSNTTALRGRKISYVVIHYTAGITSRAGSAENTASWFMNPAAQASADFIVDDGGIVQYNPDIENRYCWHCGGSKYGNKGGSLYGIVKNANSIGIEICSTNSAGRVTNANDRYWSYTDAALAKALELTKYLMRKYGISADHVVRHYDVNGKPCPGIIGWNEETGDISKWRAFKSKLNVNTTDGGLQASIFANLSEAQVIAKVGPLFTADQRKSGVLASLSLSQFILESGYGKSELAQKANNCFGMKKSLSGNTWSGSAWDGKSVYTKQTKEQNTDGSYVTIKADFRKYSCVEDSIADHSAYLLGAKNGSAFRYAGLKGCTDYKKAAQIVKDGGYATSLTYVDKLCSIIERWNLTQYDASEAGSVDNSTYPEKLTTGYYRVRKSWNDAKSQLGAYRVLKNAKQKADENRGYYVFSEQGVAIYPAGNAGTVTHSFQPYQVRVSITDLNIRKGPGTNHQKTGKYTGRGVFTIVEEAAGQGASKWGRLKSGAGWISLDYAAKI